MTNTLSTITAQPRCVWRPFTCALVTLVLLLPSVGTAAVCANLSLVDIGLGSSVIINGQATGPSLGGLMHWNQVQPNAPSLWNGRVGFSESSFVSIALNATWDRDFQSDQTYHFQTLQGITGASPPDVSPLAAAYIGQLWHSHMAETVNAKNVGFAGPRRTMIGAMQTAIWKLVYDQGVSFDLGSGNVRVTEASPASALAQQWLNELQQFGPSGPQANLVALVGDQGQVHITEATVLAQVLVEQTVPEPSAVVVWGVLGVIGVAIRGWISRNSRRAAVDEPAFVRGNFPKCRSAWRPISGLVRVES